MPDANWQVSLGEQIAMNKVLKYYDVKNLTPKILPFIKPSIMKTDYDSKRFEKDAVKILKMVQSGELSFSD